MIKKISVILLCSLLASCAVGDSDVSNTSPEESSSYHTKGNRLNIIKSKRFYVDEETGCQYIQAAYAEGVWTPRIDSDGVTHKGCRHGSPLLADNKY